MASSPSEIWLSPLPASTGPERCQGPVAWASRCTLCRKLKRPKAQIHASLTTWHLDPWMVARKGELSHRQLARLPSVQDHSICDL